MNEGEDFIQRENGKNNHCSPVSNQARCDLNSKGDALNLHDFSHKPKYSNQKQFNFTARQFQLEGAEFKKTMKKIFQRESKSMEFNF